MIAVALVVSLLVAQTPDSADDQPAPKPSRGAAEKALKNLPPNLRDRSDIKSAEKMSTIQKPKTCEGQCDLVKSMMTSNCSQPLPDGKKMPATAVKKCEENAKGMVDACMSSCKDKGRLDADYVKSKIKMPSQAAQSGADRADP